MKYLISFIAILIIIYTPLSAFADVTVDTYLDRYDVRIGDQVNLTVNVESTEGEPGNPVFPDLPWARIYSTGSSSGGIQIQMGTGQGGVHYTRTATFNYILVPMKTGIFDITGISVNIKNKIYTAKPLRLNVSGQGSSPPAMGPIKSEPKPQTAEPNVEPRGSIFLDIQCPVTEVYVDQMIPVTFSLYSLLNVREVDFNALDNAKFTGVWKEVIPPPNQFSGYQRNIGGTSYTVYDLRKFCLFPIDKGEITIEPVSMQCGVLDTQRRTQDIFDAFFQRTKVVNVVSNPLTIKVKPLPEEGKPASFTGTVGKFKIEATTDKSEVEVGDAFTLRVRIFGEGNIEHIGAPILPDLADFTQYDPVRNQTIERRKGIIEGEAVYEYILVPQKESATLSQPVKYNYFDPESGKYVHLEEYINLKILPSTKTSDEETIIVEGEEGKRKIILQTEDLKHIITDASDLSNRGNLIYKNEGFWVLQTAPLTLFLIAWVFRIKKDKLEKDPVGARMKKAYSKAAREFMEIKKDASPEVYSRMGQILLHYVSERYNCYALGLTHESLLSLLKEKGIHNETGKLLIDLLSELDGVRFAPGETTSDEKEYFRRKSEEVLKQLELKK